MCLSGLECLNLESRPIGRRALFILNVIPEDAVTHLIVSTSSENRDLLAPYMSAIQGGLAFINTVEAAMLQSTDHWFLSPTVWETLPEQRKNAILAAISFDDGNAIAQNSHSVFDLIRSRLLDEIEAAKPEFLRTDNERKVISVERSKLV